ncbi:MAG: hypothetical protein P8Y70_18440 [Candidatus Lokiarchaeota archaeon]
MKIKLEITKGNPLFWAAILPLIPLIFALIIIFPVLLNMPIIFPIFLFDWLGYVISPISWTYVILSIIAAIGIFKNRMWGFWIGVLNTIINIYVSLTVDFSAFQNFYFSIILILFIYWYFGEKTINPKE